jgi:hypothetical protein
MIALFLIESPSGTQSFIDVTRGMPIDLVDCAKFRLVGVYANEDDLEKGRKRVRLKLERDGKARDLEASGQCRGYYDTGNPRASYQGPELTLLPRTWERPPEWAGQFVCTGVEGRRRSHGLGQPVPTPAPSMPAAGDLDDLLMSGGPGPQPPQDPHQELGLGLAY